jgi:hypothetical protein
MTQTEDETKDEPAEEEDEPLTDEERALFDAAYAYYEAGCDGNCDECEYYDYCPAEEEVDPDDEEIMWGITQGDVQKGAENGINLAKETAQTAREFKEAMDDIRSVVDPREWFK